MTAVKDIDKAAIQAWRDLLTAHEMRERARMKDVRMPRTATLAPFTALVVRCEDRLVKALDDITDPKPSGNRGPRTFRGIRKTVHRDA